MSRARRVDTPSGGNRKDRPKDTLLQRKRIHPTKEKGLAHFPKGRRPYLLRMGLGAPRLHETVEVVFLQDLVQLSLERNAPSSSPGSRRRQTGKIGSASFDYPMPFRFPPQDLGGIYYEWISSATDFPEFF